MLDYSNTQRAEGLVLNFQRKLQHTKGGGETIERFTVHSIQFAYGDAQLARFNSFAKTNNDIFFDGQHLRITYKAGHLMVVASIPS